MVFKKRLDHGFNGFQVPAIPRAPRSARVSISCNSSLSTILCALPNSSSNSVNLGYWFQRRGLHKKTVEDSQICAFELLASIAGKLLQESESSASSNASEGNDQPSTSKDVKREQQNGDKPFMAGWTNQGSCGDSSLASELASQNINLKCILKEFSHAESDDALERNSIINNSDCSQKVSEDVKSVICKSKTDFGNYSSKVEGDYPHFGESCDANVKNEIQRQQEVEGLKTEGVNTFSSKEPMDSCLKSLAAMDPDSNVKLPLRQDPVPDASFSRHGNDIMLVSRDDDENLSRCFKPSTKIKASRTPPRIADRRIRKLLNSKYWKVAPKLKDCEFSRSGKQLTNGLNILYFIFLLCLCIFDSHHFYLIMKLMISAFVDGGLKPLYRKRKTFCSRERCHRDILFKRRKIFDQSSVVISDGGFSSESVSNSPEKGMTEDKTASAAMLHGGPFPLY
jgi:hypothetical protein